MAELLIVVAIIAVLVAVAIPIFGTQLENSKKAVDEANCRSAYGEAMAEYLTHQGDASPVTTSTLALAGVSYKWVYDSATDVMTVSRTTGSLKSSTYANGITYNGTSFTSGAASAAGGN